MNTWPVQDAKARFSELLNNCLSQGPQIVTRRGTETAILVPIAQWRRLNNTAHPSLKALLLSTANKDDMRIPQRGSAQRRTIDLAEK
jgi:prevent-host-death family protein